MVMLLSLPGLRLLIAVGHTPPGAGEVRALHVGLLTEDDPELMTSVPEIVRQARLKLERHPVDETALPAGGAALLQARRRVTRPPIPQLGKAPLGVNRGA